MSFALVDESIRKKSEHLTGICLFTRRQLLYPLSSFYPNLLLYIHLHRSINSVSIAPAKG